MADFNQIDPSKYELSWNGIQVTGYMSGTMITAARAEDAYAGEAGSQGDVVVVRNLNRMGTVVFTLQQSSPTNAILFASLTAGEAANSLTVGPLLVKDLNGTTFIAAENAWLMKPADVGLGDELEGREWTLECAELIFQ